MIIHTGALLWISRVKVRPDDNVELSSHFVYTTNTSKHQMENKSWPATKSVTKVIFHSIWMRGQMSARLMGTIYHFTYLSLLLLLKYLTFLHSFSLWTPEPRVLTDADLISGPWLGSRSANCSPNYLQSRPHRSRTHLALLWLYDRQGKGPHYSHTDIINKTHFYSDCGSVSTAYQKLCNLVVYMSEFN